MLGGRGREEESQTGGGSLVMSRGYLSSRWVGAEGLGRCLWWGGLIFLPGANNILPM